jgi:hypothetical protein
MKKEKIDMIWLSRCGGVTVEVIQGKGSNVIVDASAWKYVAGTVV